VLLAFEATASQSDLYIWLFFVYSSLPQYQAYLLARAHLLLFWAAHRPDHPRGREAVHVQKPNSIQQGVFMKAHLHIGPGFVMLVLLTIITLMVPTELRLAVFISGVIVILIVRALYKRAQKNNGVKIVVRKPLGPIEGTDIDGRGMYDDHK